MLLIYETFLEGEMIESKRVKKYKKKERKKMRDRDREVGE